MTDPTSTFAAAASGATDDYQIPKDINLLVASPAYDGVRPNYFVASHALRTELNRRGIPATFVLAPGMPVDAARDAIANSFRRSKQFTHVLMSDNDIGTPAWTVLRMLERQVDFAVAAPPLRRLRLDMALEAFKAGAPKPERFAYEYAMELLPEDKARGKVSVDDRGFMRVERAGSAFMLLSRAVFEKIADAHPELCYEADDGFRECMFFQRRIVEGKPRGEDDSFCMHWRALGGVVR